MSTGFETLAGVLRADHVVFATVGANRIKCLAPRELFFLPLIPVADCGDAAALEARIRTTLARRLEQLQQAEQWLGAEGRRALCR